VSIPRPEPGLVIRYSYLWHSEYSEGREEGQKDRPCAIVAAYYRNEAGETRVLAIPVTHSPPLDTSIAVEIPQSIKAQLRLDAERSWIVLSEWNDFAWPGPDLRPVPGVEPASFAYGFLPPRFFAAVKERFLDYARKNHGRAVKRTE
jgi:hypothetical protein